MSFPGKLTSILKGVRCHSPCHFTHSFKHAVKSGFENFANFHGRASRSEFWYWILFYALVRLGAAVLDLFVIGVDPDALVSGPLESLVSIVLIIPLLSIIARRTHDTDHSAWWMLTIVAPVYFAFIKGDVAINRFGGPR